MPPISGVNIHKQLKKTYLPSSFGRCLNSSLHWPFLVCQIVIGSHRTIQMTKSYTIQETVNILSGW